MTAGFGLAGFFVASGLLREQSPQGVIAPVLTPLVLSAVLRTRRPAFHLATLLIRYAFPV